MASNDEDGSSSSPWQNLPPTPFPTMGHRSHSGEMTGPHNSSFRGTVFHGGYSSTPQAFPSGPHGRRQNKDRQNYSLVYLPGQFAEQQHQLYRVPAVSANGTTDTTSWQQLPYEAPSQMDYNWRPPQGHNIDMAGLDPSGNRSYYNPGGMPEDSDYKDNVVLPEYDAGAEPSNVADWDLNVFDLRNADASSRMQSIGDLTKSKDDSPWSVFTTNQESAGLASRRKPLLYPGSAGSATSGTGLMTRSTGRKSDCSPSEYAPIEEVSDWTPGSTGTMNPNIAKPPMNNSQQRPQDSGVGGSMFCLKIRESTPGPQNGPQMPGSNQYQSTRSRRPPRDSRFLPVPQRSRSNSVASSPSSTSSEPSTCGFCGLVYTGVYSRGNLARHVRLKHGEKVVVYECEMPGCGREFFRQDARLKHYRKSHQHLVLRGTSDNVFHGGGPDLGISDLSNASALDTVW